MGSVNSSSGEYWGVSSEPQEEIPVSEFDAEYAASNGGLGHIEYGTEYETPRGDGATYFFDLQAAARVAAEKRRAEAAASAAATQQRSRRSSSNGDTTDVVNGASRMHHPSLTGVQRSFGELYAS